jgi:glutamine amidotransferase
MGALGIVDYGMGNLLSVENGVAHIGGDVFLCRAPEDLARAERIILPGVGAFRDCIANLRRTGFADALTDARAAGKPILGICLGMQVMAQKGYENGDYDGLGWFDADVTRLTPDDASLRVPHVGWNDTTWAAAPPPGLSGKPTPFYYVHSYRMVCRDAADVLATCDYGGAFTAAVRRENVMATQFHPEKSQDHGLALLKAFLAWKP